MPWLQAESLGGAVGSVGVDEGADPLVWLCLLGGFRLVSGGQPVPVRSGGKTETLLVHLGLAGLRGIPREVLLRTLWPHSEPSLAGQALNSVLRGLKTLLARRSVAPSPWCRPLASTA